MTQSLLGLGHLGVKKISKYGMLGIDNSGTDLVRVLHKNQ
jgi:hypothetical protein